jgi:hypothetical protein
MWGGGLGNLKAACHFTAQLLSVLFTAKMKIQLVNEKLTYQNSALCFVFIALLISGI